jgi:hypothetical protein
VLAPWKPRDIHSERENQVKPIKMFGLAILAALMGMAFAATSSALAENTALCAADEAACAEPVEHVHEETLSGAGQAVLLSSSLTVKCDVLFLGDTLAGVPNDAGTSPLIIHGSFTYSNCNNSCTATEENGPAEIKVLKEGSELAKVTGEGLVHLVCSGFINCRYNGTGLKGHGLGPLTSSETNGSTTLSEQTTNKESGALCPSTAKLDITTTPLEPTYIAAWLGYCVKTEHTNGLYTDSNCKTLGSNPPKHEFTYTLVWGPVNWGKVGETRCYDTLSHEGLWKEFSNNSSKCPEGSDDKERKSLYENGTIVVIE